MWFFLLLPLLSNYGREEVGSNLKKIADLMNQDAMKVLINDKKYGFTQVGEAHDLLEKGENIGKISLYNDF